MNGMNRFLAKVEKVGHGGCWQWVGAISTNGYGKFRGDDRRTWNAHRWSFLHIGSKQLVAGMTLDHLCRNRACVNPSHLEQVTVGENTKRGTAGQLGAARQRAKTHCAKGHPFDEANTRISRRGWRVCIACARAACRGPEVQMKRKLREAARSAGSTSSTEDAA